MPPEPDRKKRPVYRKVDKGPVVHAKYLDNLEPPLEALLRLEAVN